MYQYLMLDQHIFVVDVLIIQGSLDQELINYNV